VSAVRDIVESETSEIKLGVVGSHIESVRTRSERQTAVRVYDNGLVGMASAVGRIDLDALTAQARESLLFEIAYPAEPEGARVLSASHSGDERTLDELVEFSEAILSELRGDFPQLVFSHGVMQSREALRIRNDLGLDLSHAAVETAIVFMVKEKGSAGIFDTMVVASGAAPKVEAVLSTFRANLRAFLNPVGRAEGRQRVIFAGLDTGEASTLLKLVRTDLTAASYSTGASLFANKLNDGRAWFSDRLTLSECRDPELLRTRSLRHGGRRARPARPRHRKGRAVAGFGGR